MNFLFTPLPIPVANQYRVGICVFLADPATEQLHVGVLYAAPREELQFLHLAFHARLTCEPFHRAFRNDRPYVGVVPEVDPVLWPSVVAVCRRIIARNGQGIPYGVLYDGGRFLKDGSLELGAGARGLTCATFVLHVFESVGKTLLDIATWQPRADDAVWHRRIVANLETFRQKYPKELSQAHIEAVRLEEGCARIRPEEVVGGSTSDTTPAPFQAAVVRGGAVRARLAASVGP
ncbi:MAG: hypothetical protein HY909_31220 [Deltaproteobacteria bacterium]|nr:hypothetical protein [Deltaproteobacteria bacterium]